MADLIPSSLGDPDDDQDDRGPKVIGLDSDEADDLLGAISSSTARTVLTSLCESPATSSDLATEIDTSLQNVQYHLGNLSETGLIEVTDTRYSEKGREVNVYAPADRALVVVAGHENETKGLKSTLMRPVGGVDVLGVGAAVMSRLVHAGSVLPFGLGGPTGGVDGSGVGQSGNSGADLNATRTADSANATPATAEAASTPIGTTTETTTIDDGSGFSTAEATATVDSTTQTVGTARTAVESTPTVTEAAQAATKTVTTTSAQTPVPGMTAAQTAAGTTTRVASGSGGLVETIETLSPETLLFLGRLTVSLAWVAVGVLHG